MKKNVIFILTDDQRYNTIHALGNPEIHPPNLDWLAENVVGSIPTRKELTDQAKPVTQQSGLEN